MKELRIFDDTITDLAEAQDLYMAKSQLAINEANRQRVEAYRQCDKIQDRIDEAKIELIDFADSLPQSDPCHLDLRKIVDALCGETP